MGGLAGVARRARSPRPSLGAVPGPPLDPRAARVETHACARGQPRQRAPGARGHPRNFPGPLPRPHPRPRPARPSAAAAPTCAAAGAARDGSASGGRSSSRGSGTRGGDRPSARRRRGRRGLPVTPPAARTPLRGAAPGPAPRLSSRAQRVAERGPRAVARRVPGVSPRGPPSRGFALTRGPEAAATRGSRPGHGEGSRPRPRGSGGPRSRQARWPGRLPGARPRKMSDWLLSPGSGLGRLFPKEFRTPSPSSSRPGLGTLARKCAEPANRGHRVDPAGKVQSPFPCTCLATWFAQSLPVPLALAGSPCLAWLPTSVHPFFFFPETLFIPHDAKRALYDHVRP